MGPRMGMHIGLRMCLIYLYKGLLSEYNEDNNCHQSRNQEVDHVPDIVTDPVHDWLHTW